MASYLALLSWRKKVDCVALDRQSLLDYLGLDKMREERQWWLEMDVAPLFAHSESVHYSSGKWAGLYLSRFSFPKYAFEESMSAALRLRELNALGLKTAAVKLPSAESMARTLAFAAIGTRPFR